MTSGPKMKYLYYGKLLMLSGMNWQHYCRGAVTRNQYPLFIRLSGNYLVPGEFITDKLRGYYIKRLSVCTLRQSIAAIKH